MVLNIIALVLSAAALGFSIFVYIRHDKRLKPLELEIAQHQVNEIHEQEAAKAIANLDARSRYVKPGNLFVTITNNGQASASNVQVEVLENAEQFPLKHIVVRQKRYGCGRDFYECKADINALQ